MSAGVTLKGCAATQAALTGKVDGIEAATDGDWATEYGAPVLAIRQVPDLDAALSHIDKYGSKHTDGIITSNDEAIVAFQAAVDSANVFANASTRFADGFRYGLGAEVGISTEKFHARGPVGVDGLLTYRWLLNGDGQGSEDYGAGKKAYLHKDV